MKLITRIATFLLVALAVEVKCDFASEFIRLPEPEELSQPYHRQIADAVERLHLAEGADLRVVRLGLRAALVRDGVDPADREVYRRFVSLLEGDKLCPADLVKHIKSVVAQIRADPESPLAKVKHFIVRYGRMKFRRCANHIEALNLIPARSLEKRFDSLFIQALALDPWKVNDEALIDLLLDNASLANMTLNAEALFKYVRKNKVQYKSYRLKKSFGSQQQKDRTMTHLRNVLDMQCIKLEEYLGRTLDIINLAYVFGSKQMHQARLLKLALYYRLCMEWSKPGMRAQIEANILDQAKEPERHTGLRNRLRPKFESIAEGDESAETSDEDEN